MKQIVVGGTLLVVALGGPYLMFETSALQELQQRLGIAFQDTADSAATTPSTDPSFGSTPAASPTQQQLQSPTSGWFTSTKVQSPQEPQSPNTKSVYPPQNSNSPANFPPTSTQNPYPSFQGSNPQAYNPQQRTIQALQEIVRFDISPRWVIDRFPEITSVSSEPQLDGLQVSLKTGDSPSDLNGKLVYYFDHYKRVQRISMQAVSGDPSRFMAELQHSYQLQYHPTLGGELYVKKWNGRPTSLVYTALAPVVSAKNLNSRYKLYAELNQPSLEYGISQEAQRIMEMVEAKQRW